MDLTLQWLRKAEQKTGGFSAWYNGRDWQPSYLEVSGYLIPTLLEWGEIDAARRAANWLLKEQNSDGSFNGLDGTPRPFDTSAIIEGLEAMYAHTAYIPYLATAERAKEWIQSLITDDGFIPNSQNNKSPEVYNLRASAIIGNTREAEYWKVKGFPPVVRSHYLAYAIEGALNLNSGAYFNPVIDYMYDNFKSLIPFMIQFDNSWKDGIFDLCATAQWGIIFHRLGYNAQRYYDALIPLIAENGGVPQSTDDPRQIAWGAKFWLDFKKRIERDR